MHNLEGMARLLIGIGIIMLLAGLIAFALAKLGGMGLRLPGDIYIKKESFTFYFPLATCILISLILTLLFNLFHK